MLKTYEIHMKQWFDASYHVFALEWMMECYLFICLVENLHKNKKLSVIMSYCLELLCFVVLNHVKQWFEASYHVFALE